MDEYLERSKYLPSVVGPATELEFAFLIIKREPCNVYLARALKDARRDVEAAPSLIDHHVRLERAVELFVGAVVVVMASVDGAQVEARFGWLVWRLFHDARMRLRDDGTRGWRATGREDRRRRKRRKERKKERKRVRLSVIT